MRTKLMSHRHFVFVLAMGLPLVGCSVETVVSRLTEKEANTIIELFADNQIESTKGVIDTGREVHHSISVSSKKRLEAIRLLNLHELPRRKDKGYSEIFSESGLIPTSAEEKAKKLAALEGEIQKQLKLIDGILDAQVQIVIPETTALQTAEDQIAPTTASVTIRYLPGAGGTKPISEAQVQTLVAAGVEKLTADRVFPLMTPVRKSEDLGLADTKATAVVGNSWLAKYSAKTVNTLTVVILAIILGLSLLLLFGQVKLRTVRGRLIRLQNEISKARRKSSSEILPPSAS